MPEPAEPPREAPGPVEEFAVVDVPRELADDWNDVFAWSYGQRFWNIGCG